MAEPVTLIVSIDTEEDNWDPALTGLTVENIRELPRLDRLFERLGVRATYFTTHQVAVTGWSAEIIRGLAAGGRAEIGAHLHPWNTPPLTQPLTVRNTMLSNLPRDLQVAKITTITQTLAAVIGERPYSFRAGRWGFNASTAAALIEGGYRADSSVTPFKTWSEDSGPSHVGAPLDVYRLDGRGDHRTPAPGGPLVEVPLSWGYTQRPWGLLSRVHRALDLPFLRGLRVASLAERLHVINQLVLSPEIDIPRDMMNLARRLLARGVRHLHVTFHSPSLRAGLSPFTGTAAAVERLYRDLATVIEGIESVASVRFATVAEAATALAPSAVGGQSVAPRITPAPAGTAERRLLVVSFHFRPDPAIGGRRWSGLTKYLAALGWRSWVVTAAPRAQREVPGVEVSSHPRLLTLNDLYRRWRMRHRVAARERSAIVDAPSDAPEETSWLRRLFYEGGVLLSLPDEARGWVLRAARATRRLIRQVRPTVIVSSGPPHSAHLAAWLATRFTKTPWFVDLRDPWAGPLTDAWRSMPSYRSSLARGLTQWLERLVMHSATTILCNTREFASALAERYPTVHIEWVPNGVDRDLLPSVPQDPFPGLGMVHVGTVYGGRDFGPVLVALRALLDRHPTAATDGTRLRIAGHVEAPYAGALRQQIDDLGLGAWVEFLGVLPRDEALRLVGRSRLALVLAQGQEFQVPAKLYEMAAMGIATVALAPKKSATSSEAARLGASAVDPRDTEELIELMEKLRNSAPGEARAPSLELDYRHLAVRVNALLSAVPRS